MRVEPFERFASVGCLRDHAHVRLSCDKASNALTDEPVIVDCQDTDNRGVAAHDFGILGVAAKAPRSQERRALSAVS